MKKILSHFSQKLFTKHLACLFLVSFLGLSLKTIAQTTQGIGTSNPNSNVVLDVFSNTKGVLLPRMTTAQRNTFGSTLAAADMGITVYDTDVKSYFAWDGTAFMQLQQGTDLWSKSGSNIFPTALADNIGVGTNTPGYKLEVNGTLRSSGITESSDARWKKDVFTIDHALDKVLKLRGVTYHWRKEEFREKNFNDQIQMGLIAQEVELVVPEVVNTDKQGFKSIEYSKLVALLIEALKSQQAQIDHLKNENIGLNTALSSKIDELKAKLNALEVSRDPIANQPKSSLK